MPPPIRPRTATGRDGLQWVQTDDGSLTLWHAGLDETYHSGCGAIAESLMVYLWNSLVWQRLCDGRGSRVLEYGFGTGTSFLLTAAAAEFHRTPLDYWALEIDVLPHEFFRLLKLNEALTACFEGDHARIRDTSCPFARPHFAALEWLTEQLANQCSQHGELEPFRTYHLQLSEFVTLHLIVGDATDLPWLAAQGVAADAFHAVYFDAFSPESSPAMWGDGVLRYASDRLQRGGTLTSYCVKGDVKRSLRACGMQVITAPGPVHGKREVLIATRPISQGMGRA